ncbi:MAG: cysteine--1-D-myo-inosityl 2-amino-2-deoxy-alpha-D-glucopyranoside ligase [Actinomycetota bacterium]
MIPWPAPSIPLVPGHSAPVRLFNHLAGEKRSVHISSAASLYVCGITPYDATHLGHAATYTTFDVLHRAWLDSGNAVRYVQNVTDVDDPLLERASRDGLPWHELADRELALFAQDMTALGILPPTELVGVVDSMATIAADVRALLASGDAYRLPVPPADLAADAGDDIYASVRQAPHFGEVSGFSASEMTKTFAERGGDPQRPGKRDPLDALLWRAARPGEPSWDGGELGIGRPGWHVECASIANRHLGLPVDVQGGGTDLLFPHHEMSATHGQQLTGVHPYARHYVHQAMVGLDGQKMSKSRGNLVLVSTLLRDGYEPAAIRLLLLKQHYRSVWSYSQSLLTAAQERTVRWRHALSREGGPPSEPVIAHIRAAVADDLDTPSALDAVDAWVDAQLALGGPFVNAAGALARALDTLLGVRL